MNLLLLIKKTPGFIKELGVFKAVEKDILKIYSLVVLIFYKSNWDVMTQVNR